MGHPRHKRLNKSLDDLFGPGDDTCRVCEEDVVNGRWSYCSKRCRRIAYAVQQIFIWDTVREKVFERDDHTCRRCGLSKEMWERAYWQVRELVDDKTAHLREQGDLDEWRATKRELKDAYDVESPHTNAYHVDHIKPLSKGGHPLDETNLQTLCRECHQEKTAESDSSDAMADAIPISEYVE